LGAGQWEAYSAGSTPAGYVHPLAIKAMKEVGVDLSGNGSKHVDEFVGQAFDLVVTVCDSAKETCPTLPGAKKIVHWPFEDPADATGTDDQKLRTFRQVRDEIAAAIHGYLEG
jgi:arsenate reductase